MEAMRRSSTARKVVIGGFVAVVLCLIYLYISGDTSMAKEEARHPRWIKSDKVKSEGIYKSFYGYTIISPAEDPQRYKNLEEFIRKSHPLSLYFAPLPASSYHVTMFDIFSQRRIPEKYVPQSGVVPSNYWLTSIKNLKTDLLAAQKHCENVKGNLQFLTKEVKITKSGMQIQGDVSMMKEVTSLREQCTAIFERAASPTVFHLSLAYKIREIDEENLEEVNREMVQLRKLVNSVYPLLQPRVCYFESMEAFEPIANLPLFRTSESEYYD